MTEVTLNSVQRLFVLKHSEYTSCLGFDVVFKRLAHYAKLLKFPEPVASQIGTVEQYEHYKRAETAYIKTAPQGTLYEPGTLPAVAACLEKCRESRAQVRLFFGDPETGIDWMEEWDVMGRISRTTGPLKAPILVPKGEDGGGIINTEHVLRIMLVASGKELYRNKSYQVPTLTVVPSSLTGYSYEVLRDTKPMARFKSESAALGWVAFMQGQSMRRGRG